LKPCYDLACELLARRPHFRGELAGKLARRGYAPADLEAALDRLAAQGYLDDLAAARGFVAGRAARGEGRARLRAELERRGAAPSAVAVVLAELPEDDLPAARLAARRWRGSSRQALARHLARKGLSRRAIFAVLNEGHAGADPSAADATAETMETMQSAEAVDDFEAIDEARIDPHDELDPS
jgi:regulatory protein